MSTVPSDQAPQPITIPADELDADGFVSLWNVASASRDGDTPAVRELASKLLLFLCKKQCDFVVTSTANAEYLDNWFERDKNLLYNWKPDSEFVDVVAQHAEVPGNALLSFLRNENFDPSVNHNATRAARVKWFQEMWNVG
ncbi:hypothetical protein [Roseimaritima sediminicola]|uniref:hypothetical protein n=1 Tax=Roseimaritima sediminicola TaxID=2662066 RepID=UPI0012983FB8|nr:hypothetical protein [Roseimaritima sediminicola]